MLGTGIDASVLVFIPMAGTISPYIPFHFAYNNSSSDYWASYFSIEGGVGVEAGFGPVAGYLEGGINFLNVSPNVGDGDSHNWFYVQGGIRIPVNL